MSKLSETKIFNNPQVLIEGWYWALKSSELKAGSKIKVRLMGRDLVFKRDSKGRPQLVGDKFPLEEKYGLVWIWSGEKPRHRVPFVPELEGQEVDWQHGNTYVKGCHPNPVLINAIDAQHFNTVHPEVKRLAGQIHFDPVVQNENNIHFLNTTPVPRDWWVGRILGRFYKKAMTYQMSYWYGSTGIVTVGPDALHFHIIFALRPNEEGLAEGQTILVTQKRPGLSGWIANRCLLFLTRLFGNYFGKGDTLIFSSIRFKLRTPIKADTAIIRFIQHAELQPLSPGWNPLQGRKQTSRKTRIKKGA